MTLTRISDVPVSAASLQTNFDSRYLRIVNNLSDVASVVSAVMNLGLNSGGANDIWVHRTGDTMTGTLNINIPNQTTKGQVIKGVTPLNAVYSTVGNYYKLDEATATTATDSAGSISLTATGTSVVAGALNNARSFNGTSDYLSANSAPITNTTNWSISAWIKASSLSNGGNIAVYNGDDNGGFGFGINAGSGGSGNKLVGLFGSIAWLNTGFVWPDTTTYHHVVMTRDSSTTTLYFDAVSKGTFANTPNGPAAKVSIGMEYNTSDVASNFFAGAVDEASFFPTTALSSSQVTILYNSGSPLPYTPPLNMEEWQNNTASVVASINNDGRLSLLAGVDTTLFLMKMFATQSTDVLQIQNSSGTVITRLSPKGYFSTNATSKVNIFTIKAGANFTGTGTTTVNGSNTTVIGVGTKFTVELGVGDRFSVSSNPTQFVTVGSITDDTHLTLANGEPSIGDGTVQTFQMQKALFGMQDANGNTQFIVSPGGFVGVAGKVNPDVSFSTNGDTRLNGHNLYFDTDNSEGIVKTTTDGANLTYFSFGGHLFQTSDGGGQNRFYINKTRIGINNTSPTALFHFAAGTASAQTAPYKIPSGTNMTTAEAGAAEYNGNFYFTQGGAVRYSVGGTIFDHYADAGNTHTDGVTFDDLYSDTTAANTFNTNGDKVKAEYGGIFVSSGTATREIKVLFAGTTILDTGSLTTATADSWYITVTIIRESSTVVRCQTTIVASTTLGAQAFNDTTYTRITGLTLSGTNILKVQAVSGGVGAAASDIVAKLGSVYFQPAI